MKLNTFEHDLTLTLWKGLGFSTEEVQKLGTGVTKGKCSRVSVGTTLKEEWEISQAD